MQFFSNLAKSPVETLDTWQKTRYPWAIMAATMAGLVLVAHFVFQEWLYMAPCEQCVYIRYGNLVMALGGLIALINPRILALRLAAYAVSFYGLIYTMICSWKLMAIHDAVHSDDPAATFGIQGCSAEALNVFTDLELPGRIMAAILEKKVSLANGYSVIMIQDLTRPRVKMQNNFLETCDISSIPMVIFTIQ